ncbi:MAG: MFS transporter [Gammaproteobacteria bacterium]|nr:MFS transporter [Gammaproteobacteria bacterium]
MKPPSGVYLGWWMVAASAVGLSTNPGQFAYGALGVFMLPLIAEFGWSRTEVSMALTIFTVTLAISLPVLGILVDRYGARRVLVPSVLVFGLLLLAIPAVVSRTWHLWLLFALIGSLAAGANSLPYMRILGAWFDRRRGLAFGFAMAGGGAGYMYVPPLLQWLIDQWGWRSGYLVLGGLVLLIAAPIAAFVLRDSPGECGVAAEDAAPAVVGPGSPGPASVRLGLLASLFAIFAVLSLCLYGLLAHLVPMLVDRGAPAPYAARVAALLGVAILISRAAVGYLIDRWSATRVAAGCAVFSAAGMAWFSAGAFQGPAVWFATGLVGLSIGAEIDILAFLTSRYFGLRRFGRMYGVLFAAFLLGTAAGPVTYGALFDLTGAYNLALQGGAAMLVCCAVAMAGLPRYKSEVQ